MEKNRVKSYRSSGDASGVYYGRTPDMSPSHHSASQCGNLADLTRNSVILLGQAQLVCRPMEPPASPTAVKEIQLVVMG